MIDVVNLALPYFGLIFIGFVCGKVKKIPHSALAWMDFFILYVSLPALFYRILAKTPVEQLAQLSFVAGTTLATALAFAMAFGIGLLFRPSHIREATIAALAGGYGNIGYMGPGLALATLGPAAAVPVALIFCFDSIFLFSAVPLLMALAARGERGTLAIVFDVLRRIVLHPLLIASALGVLSATLRFQPPVALDRLLEFLQVAAAPTALFALGVTVALRPLERVPTEIPLLAVVKLVLHPIMVLVLLSLFGRFDPLWIYTAVLMAALPPALNVYVFARQYDVWLEEASSAVLFGTAVSVVTLTAVMWLVKMQALPLRLFGP
ncbi:MAG TPA: AEC family transporter [Xanthobacteraceae bacterium]|nr:AEC family transporter [Xanthobacteraceae bacterium]